MRGHPTRAGSPARRSLWPRPRSRSPGSARRPHRAWPSDFRVADDHDARRLTDSVDPSGVGHAHRERAPGPAGRADRQREVHRLDERRAARDGQAQAGMPAAPAAVRGHDHRSGLGAGRWRQHDRRRVLGRPVHQAEQRRRPTSSSARRTRARPAADSAPRARRAATARPARRSARRRRPREPRRFRPFFDDETPPCAKVGAGDTLVYSVTNPGGQPRRSPSS